MGNVGRYKSCPPTHFSKWRYYFHLFAVRFIIRPVFVAVNRPQVHGRENVPKNGRFIVVSNHIGRFDPIPISHAIDHPIAYVGKKELFENRLVAEFCRFMGGFALDRERPGVASLKTAFNVLRSRANWALGMFPEGTRSRTNELLPLKKGVGVIAQKTGLPVLPVGIQKNNSGCFVVTVGKLIIDVSDADVVQQKVYKALVELTRPDAGQAVPEPQQIARSIQGAGRLTWCQQGYEDGRRPSDSTPHTPPQG